MCNTRLKWISTVQLIHIEDILANPVENIVHG